MDPVSHTFGGHTLNIAERTAVEASILKIKVNENFKNVRFWGKVFGVARDYLIIQAVVDHAAKKYFYSNDEGVNFAVLPPVDAWVAQKCKHIRTLFTGDQAFIYADEKKADEKSDEAESDAEDEPKQPADEDADAGDTDEHGDKKKAEIPKVEPRRLNELERLAYCVAEIERDCGVVPKGAHMMTALKDIKSDPQFAGLSLAEAQQLCSYLHYRQPESKKVQARLEKKGVGNQGPLFDAIDTDLPHGFWSLQIDDCGLNASLRSFVWPGYFFEHKLATQHFVDAYYGDGLRNDDAIFLQ